MSFYEGSAGVPLVVSWPGHFSEGRREAMPVTLADLAPTLASLGGAPPIPGVRLSGFADVLRGDPGDTERAVFSELIGDSVGARLPKGPSGGPSRMMRKGGWKCNYYHGEPPELFHLAEDPEEMVDLASDPACRTTLEAMLAEILSDWDPEDVAVRAEEQRKIMDYVRSAPGDPDVLMGERWRGPQNYGYVRPV
jgi:choline-sulfatase